MVGMGSGTSGIRPGSRSTENSAGNLSHECADRREPPANSSLKLGRSGSLRCSCRFSELYPERRVKIRGRGVPQNEAPEGFGGFDEREAFQWLSKAAAQGLPNAQFSLGQMYEDGEGVPESDSVAASWYREAADHSPAYLGGVWEAEVQLAYMYRDGRLKDKVQAYMWFAIVGSSVDPPTDDDMRQVARHMTRAQIVQAQHLAEDWIKRHPWQRQTNVATSPSPTR